MKHLKPAAHYGDIYQDIRVGGEVVYAGWRDCSTRWEIIKPHIRPRSVVVDLGSNAGYFTQRIATEIEDSLVWSMEYVPARAELQRDMLLENETKNVYLTTHKMDLFSFLRIRNSVNRIDAVLALNVLEYFSPDELFALLTVLSQISPALIAEFPHPEEERAASYAETMEAVTPADKYLRKFYQVVRLIGKSKSTTDATLEREIYHCSSPYLYSEKLLGYLTPDGMEYGGRRHTLAFSTDKRKWILDGAVDLSESAPALNLCNLVFFGLMYPDAEALHPQIEAAYKAVADQFGPITDIHLRNILCTPAGIRVIDYLEHYGKANVYGRPREGEEGFDAIFAGYLKTALIEIKNALEPQEQGGKER